MGRPIKPPRIEVAANGYYNVHWHDGERSRRESLETKCINEAKARFSYWLVATNEITETPTVAALIRLYESEHAPQCADKDRIKQRLAFINQFFGELTPDEITHDKVIRYVQLRPVKPSTVRGELGIFKAALNYAVKTRRLAVAPYIDMPPASEPRDRWLSKEEIDRLLAAAESRRSGERMSRVERFIWIAVEAAPRKRSIELLTWDRVDLDHGTIDFRVPGKQLTKKRQVVVPISNRLHPILQLAYDQRESNYVLDAPSSIRKSFENATIAAGLSGVSPHTLRHTAATHMARNGVSLWHIAGVLGNTMQTVEKTYAHHCPDALREAINYVR